MEKAEAASASKTMKENQTMSESPPPPPAAAAPVFDDDAEPYPKMPMERLVLRALGVDGPNGSDPALAVAPAAAAPPPAQANLAAAGAPLAVALDAAAHPPAQADLAAAGAPLAQIAPPDDGDCPGLEVSRDDGGVREIDVCSMTPDHLWNLFLKPDVGGGYLGKSVVNHLVQKNHDNFAATYPGGKKVCPPS
jgi:hypothetical protein